MRPLTVPRGRSVPAAISAWVMSLKYARKMASFWSAGNPAISVSMAARSGDHGSASTALSSWRGPSSTASTSTGRMDARRQASIARLRTMPDSQAPTVPRSGRYRCAPRQSERNASCATSSASSLLAQSVRACRSTGRLWRRYSSSNASVSPAATRTMSARSEVVAASWPRGTGRVADAKFMLATVRSLSRVCQRLVQLRYCGG